MNLILCEPNEVAADNIVILTGARATHVRSILNAKRGETVRIGVIDGPKGRGEVLSV